MKREEATRGVRLQSFSCVLVSCGLVSMFAFTQTSGVEKGVKPCLVLFTLLC